MDILLCFEIRSAVPESMKKPGVVPGFDDSRQAPDGANPRRGGILSMRKPGAHGSAQRALSLRLSCGAVNCQKVN